MLPARAAFSDGRRDSAGVRATHASCPYSAQRLS